MTTPNTQASDAGFDRGFDAAEPDVSKPAIFLDSFSGTAAELPKGRRTDADVLEALLTDPRVSTFDMGELPWLRSAIKALKANGSIVELDEPYPWLRFKVLKGQP